MEESYLWQFRTSSSQVWPGDTDWFSSSDLMKSCTEMRGRAGSRAQWGQCVPTAAPAQHLEGQQGLQQVLLARTGWKNAQVERKLQTWRKERKSPKPQPWNKTPFGLYSDFQKEKSSQEVEGGHNKKNAVNPEQGKQVHACAQMDTGAWTWSYFKDQTRISDTKSWSCDATWEELTISCCPCCFYLHPLALLSLKCYLGQQLKTFIWYSTLMVGFRAFLLTLLCCSNRVCIVGVVKDRKVLHIFGCNALSRWDISPIASRIKHGVTLELLKRSYLNSTGWLS